MKKTLITILATVLVCCFAVGGTLAWLVDSTSAVENTFTVGKVDIDLIENTGYEYKMIPGNELPKDPTVKVLEGSENCWLFVKIEKTNNLDTYLEYSVNSDWTPLPGNVGVYYIEDAKAGDTYSVLTNDKVTVKTTLTATDMATANANKPKLTFTAYAAQAENLETAAEAWAAVQNPNT